MCGVFLQQFMYIVLFFLLICDKISKIKIKRKRKKENKNKIISQIVKNFFNFRIKNDK